MPPFVWINQFYLLLVNPSNAAIEGLTTPLQL